jgi:hypothetical protein
MNRKNVVSSKVQGVRRSSPPERAKYPRCLTLRCSRHSASKAVEFAAGLCAGRWAVQVVVRS